RRGGRGAARRPASLARRRAQAEAAGRAPQAGNMSERADHLLAALLVLAAAAAGALVAAFVEVGLHGALELGAVALGVASACVLVSFELRHLPPALILLAATVLISTTAFLRVLYRVGREQRILRRLPTAPIPASVFGLLDGP